MFFWDSEKCDGNERRRRKSEEMTQKINEAHDLVKRFGGEKSEIYRADRALELLRKAANQPNAEFREGQEEAIRQVVNGRGRMLVVQKTGWGKSFVYFIATKLLREAGRTCAPRESVAGADAEPDRGGEADGSQNRDHSFRQRKTLARG